MPETIYKISSKDSDLYYLFINYNPTKNKLVYYIIHCNIIIDILKTIIIK